MNYRINLVIVVLAAMLSILMTTVVSAQNPTDKVVKTDGSTVDCILSDISPEEIKFKKASYPTGPTYTLPIKQVKKIILATGEEEVFDSPEEMPTEKGVSKDAIPFTAEKFLVYSEDGQSIVTDLTSEENKRYLCVWNLDMELTKKIQISKYWNFYAQQIANNGNYLDRSVYYNKDGAELRKFKQKVLFVDTELSGLNHPGIVSPTGKRILIHEPSTGSSNREDFYLFSDEGKLIKNFHNSTIEGFLFSHKNDLGYLITLHVGKYPTHIEIFDANGVEVGTIKVGSIMNNMEHAGGLIVTDKVAPQFSFDDQYIISKTDYSFVVVADVKGNVIRKLYAPMANAMTFSRDGKKIATAGATYFGHSQTIDDENGNKIDYAGGSIKIWSFEGQLLKEINFSARVDGIQFTPNGDGLAILIGDTGACVLLSEKDDYKLPEEYEKSIEEMAKYQGQKHDDKVKDKRLVFWVDLGVSTFQAVVAGKAKVEAEKNRLLAQEKKAFRLSDAIAKRNNNPNSPAKSNTQGKCRFEFEVLQTWGTDGKMTSITMSNIYTVSSTNATRNATPPGNISSKRMLYVYSSWVEANKAQEKEGETLEDKYDVEIKQVKRQDQCK